MSDDTSTDAPLDWPEDDSPPPAEPEATSVGMSPPGGGPLRPGGWEQDVDESGADTVTENHTDEDEDAER